MGKFSYWGVVVYVDGMPGQYKARIWVEASPDGEGVIVRVRSYHHNLPAITEMKDAVMALMTKKLGYPPTSMNDVRKLVGTRK